MQRHLEKGLARRVPLGRFRRLLLVFADGACEPSTIAAAGIRAGYAAVVYDPESKTAKYFGGQRKDPFVRRFSSSHALPHRRSGATCNLVGLISPKTKCLAGAISPQLKAWCGVTPGRFDISHTQDGNTYATWLTRYHPVRGPRPGGEVALAGLISPPHKMETCMRKLVGFMSSG